MDFTNFIASGDIAEYLREINYSFTAPEAAFLVYQNENAALEEKFTAWEWIINNMPDCSVKERRNMNAVPSFHAFLGMYIELQKKCLNLFRQRDNSVFLPSYCTKLLYSSDERAGKTFTYYNYTDICFSNIGDCVAHMKKEAEEYEEDELKELRIKKIPIDEPRQAPADTLTMNRNGEILSVDIHGLTGKELDTVLTFDGMWFAFPTPFKRGDILIRRGGYYEETFVLGNLCTWDSETCRKQGVREKQAAAADRILANLLRDGDTTDMSASVYIISDYGEIIPDNIDNYLSFEKNREPLKSRQRLLMPLSRALKNEIDDVVEFHDALRLIEAEENTKEIRKELYYTDEFYDLIGCKRETED